MSDSSLLALTWPSDLLNSPLVFRLGWVILHTLWQFLAIALVAAVIYSALKGGSATARYLTLMMATGLMAAAPLVTWFTIEPPRSAVSTEHEFASAETAAQTSTVASTIGPDWATTKNPPPAPVLDDTSRTEWSGVAPTWWQTFQSTSEPWLPVIVLAWCFGVLVCATRPVCSWLRVRWICKVGVERADDQVQELLAKLCHQMQLTRHVEVLVSSVVQSPVVVGAFRSVILLPVNFVASASLEHLRAILAHELAHVRRYDYLANLAQTLLETLFFYHPGVWWLSTRLRIERENCCDDLAAAVVKNRVEYGRALLAVEELRTEQSQLVIGAKDGSLGNRVRRLFDLSEPDSSRGGAGILAVSLVSMTLLGAVCTSIFASELGSAEGGDDESPRRFVAEISDGIVVELLAISSEGDTTWRADGTPFATAPVLPDFDASKHNLQNRGRKLFLRWLRLDKGRGISIEAPNWRFMHSLREGEDTSRLLVERKDAEFVDVSVSVTDVDWGPWIKVDAQGQILEAPEIPAACRQAYELIKPDHIDGQTTVSLFCWKGLHDSDNVAQFDVVALDTEGNRVKYYARTAWNGPDRTESAEVFPLPIKKIDHFEYRLRPYRYLVTFNNVALEPQSEGSNVSVRVKTIPIAASEKSNVPDDQEEADIKVTGKALVENDE